MNVKLVLCRGKGLRIRGNIMRDQDFSYFIEKFGEATSYSAVPEKSMTKWKGILPDKLLSYWKTEDGERIKMDCLVLSILMSMKMY